MSPADPEVDLFGIRRLQQRHFDLKIPLVVSGTSVAQTNVDGRMNTEEEGKHKSKISAILTYAIPALFILLTHTRFQHTERS